MPNYDNLNQYFGSAPGDELAHILEQKASDWSNGSESSGWLEKLRRSYACYHGAYYNDVGGSHQISFTGQQGELLNLPINHYRNLLSHMLNITVSNRPSLDCRATNSDYKSQVQTYLANDILDYYLREKKVEVYLKQAVEYAIVYGSGWLTLRWDANKGEMFDYIEDTKTKVYEGDIVFECFSPFDILLDNSRESQNFDWVCIRRWKNKFDLAAKYPELAEKIVGIKSKSEIAKYRIGLTNYLDKTDDIQVLEFYHDRTDAVPDGRYALLLEGGIVLQDLALPYRSIPVFRITPSMIHGTPHGYTTAFDLLPLQEMLNALYSTVASNQNAFGVQNILNPIGSNINVNQLVGGLNIIDYNPLTGAKPEALNLTSTPAEIFKFIEMIKQDMETISGVNSVARGQPEPSLKSGTALALIQSMALQFLSGLQQSYVELIEQTGTAIVKILQDYAHTPRMVAIAGQTNRNLLKEFTGKDISNISRVIVDVGNPMSKSIAGRSQMAEQLLQYQQINAQQYVNLIHTGNLNAITEDIVHEQFLMRGENEALINGETPNAVFTENHKAHVNYHRSVLFDPELKKDTGLVARVQMHIQEHITLLQTVDPQLLQLFGEQALPPPQPQQSPSPQGPPQQEQGPPKAAQGLGPENMMPPENGIQGVTPVGGRLAGPGIEQGVRLPNLPKVNANTLANPMLQQQAMKNVRDQ